MNERRFGKRGSCDRSRWIWTQRGAQSVRHRPGASALTFDKISAGYNGDLALVDVSFSLDRGDRLAVVGPNGSGKTTLIKVAAGLLPAAAGQVYVYGYAPLGHVCIAYLPQRSTFDWRFPVTVQDVVMMGRIGRLGPLKRPTRLDRDIVWHALERVEMDSLASRRIGALSGGQQQRVFIARAMAQEAELMLMDEPLVGLDTNSRDAVLQLVTEMAGEGVTVVVALHDLGVASTYFNVVLLLKRHAVGFGSPPAVFTPNNLREAYGSCLRMVKTDEGLFVVHDTACTGSDDVHPR
jgi:manganese/iron transport system ATP-binding protein